MELILTKNVEKVGRKGDVVRVRDGYARNFLIPRGVAIMATRQNREFVEEQRARSEKRRAREREAAQKEAEKLKDLKVRIEAKTGDQGKLFGSITADNISEALTQQGYSFDRKKIHLAAPIRAVGQHSVSVEIYPQVKVTISVEVTAEQ